MRYVLILLLQVGALSVSGRQCGGEWSSMSFWMTHYNEKLSGLPTLVYTRVDGKVQTFPGKNGQVVFVGEWTDFCDHCTMGFQPEERLLKRLHEVQLDTSVADKLYFESINSMWETVLRQYQPTEADLFSGDSSLYTRLNFNNIPLYVSATLSPKRRIKLRP